MFAPKTTYRRCAMHAKTPNFIPCGPVTLYPYNEKAGSDFYLELVKDPDTRRFLDPVHSSVLEELDFLRLCANDPRTMIYTIKQGPRRTLVGSVMLTGIDTKHRRAKISRLMITPEHRHAGLAHQTLHALSLFAFRGPSLRLRFLYCYVFASNAGGQQLFSKFGFEQYGRRPEWSWDGTEWVDELEMRLTAERYHELYAPKTP